LKGREKYVVNIQKEKETEKYKGEGETILSMLVIKVMA
jgi:hypothetical protein